MVDNAVIMAAGTSSRFAPLSYERHKGLTVVKGEVLIEREIRQLQEAGISEIYIVTGYKAEQFEYLPGKFGVHLIHNADYLTRNNNGSIWAARKVLKNSFICSADNYFMENPFCRTEDSAYYAAQYSDGPTDEWCMEEDERGYIKSVVVGGRNSWYMLGHVFWDEQFSRKFLGILEAEYDFSKDLLWESIFIKHLEELPMKIRKYANGLISEFDTLDELREFDLSYVGNTRSKILKDIAAKLDTTEAELHTFKAFKGTDNEAIGFTFLLGSHRFKYLYSSKELKEEN